MDVFEAVYRVAHDFMGGAAKGGGAVKLAEKLLRNPGTFLNQVNPETETHKLHLETAILMQMASGDHRILHAEAGMLGEVCFKVPDLSHVSDDALLELMCKVGAEGGDFYRVTNQALQKSRFTREEMAKVRHEGLEFIAAIAETMARMEGLIDE